MLADTNNRLTSTFECTTKKTKTDDCISQQQVRASLTGLVGDRMCPRLIIIRTPDCGGIHTKEWWNHSGLRIYDSLFASSTLRQVAAKKYD